MLIERDKNQTLMFMRKSREEIEKQQKVIRQNGKFSYGVKEPTTGIFTTCKSIECGLRIVQIPITFKKRIGISKSGAEKKNIAFRFGLDFIWSFFWKGI